MTHPQTHKRRRRNQTSNHTYTHLLSAPTKHIQYSSTALHQSITYEDQTRPRIVVFNTLDILGFMICAKWVQICYCGRTICMVLCNITCLVFKLCLWSKNLHSSGQLCHFENGAFLFWIGCLSLGLKLSYVNLLK